MALRSGAKIHEMVVYCSKKKSISQSVPKLRTGIEPALLIEMCMTDFVICKHSTKHIAEDLGANMLVDGNCWTD